MTSKAKKTSNESRGAKKVFIISQGIETGGQMGFAFALADLSVAMGEKIVVFLVNEGSKWAFKNFGDDYEHECFNQPNIHLENLLNSELCQVLLCQTCNQVFHVENQTNLKKNIQIGSFSDILIPNAQYLRF